MTEVLLTSGTSWTVPSDCMSATVECIGGGQGGNATNGGNGGDYAKANAVALTPGDSIAIVIGAGGSGVASGSQNAGGDTSFGTAALAKGGGSASIDVGDTTFAGGAGNASGAGGGAAGPNGDGGDASGNTGGTGDAGTTPADAAGTEWGTAGSGGGGSVVAAGGLMIVEQAFATTGASTTPSNTGIPVTLVEDIQDGDTLLVFGTIKNVGTPVGSIEDSLDSVYDIYPAANSFLSPLSIFFGIATPVPGPAPTVTAFADALCNMDIRVYHVRGKTLTYNSANVVPYKFTGKNLGGGVIDNTFTIGPYDAAANTLLLFGGVNNLGLLDDSDPIAKGWTEDFNGHTDYRPIFLHKDVTEAIAGESFDVADPSSSSTDHFCAIFVPLIYS